MNEDIIVERHESSYYRSKYFEFEERRLLLRFRRRKYFPLPLENVSINGKAAFQCIIVYCVCERSVLSVDIPQDHRIRNKKKQDLPLQRSFLHRGLVNSPSSGHEFRRHARAMSQLTSNCPPPRPLSARPALFLRVKYRKLKYESKRNEKTKKI